MMLRKWTSKEVQNLKKKIVVFFIRGSIKQHPVPLLFNKVLRILFGTDSLY